MVEMADIERDLAGQTDDGSPAATPQELFNQRLEGEHVPEHLRGKSIADVLNQVNALGEALKISEKARSEIARFADRPVASTPTYVPPAPAEKELTEDDINEMFKENPAKAINLLWNRGSAQMAAHIDGRIAPLTNAAASSAELNARAKYALEFELFGDQIAAMYNSMPDKGVFTKAEGWRDMVHFIRGNDENLEKYVTEKAARANGQATPSLREARASASANVGFSPTRTQRESVGAASVSSNDDPIKREIADRLGMDMKDYLKWERLGR